MEVTARRVITEDVLDALLEVVLPVFIVAGVGFAYAGKKDLPIGAFTDLIIYLTGACLVFDALARADTLTLDEARIPASAALMVVLGIGLSWVAQRLVPPLRTLPVGAVILPGTFMNAGNLGLPLSRLAFGAEGFALSMLFFVTVATLMYSVGIGIVAGKGGIQTALRYPLFHAALLGVAVNLLEIEVPRVILVPAHLLGQTVVPMMLLSLGGRLRELVKDSLADLPWGPIGGLVLLRIGGGALVAAAVNALLGNEGLVFSIIALVGMLPPAVMNFALVEKFSNDRRAAAAVSGAIALAVAVSFLTLPVAVSWLRG